jgi:hypothetical protein
MQNPREPIARRRGRARVRRQEGALRYDDERDGEDEDGLRTDKIARRETDTEAATERPTLPVERP